ncbi:MAG: TlpA disulfide reductase family protein [Caldilineaceae bacterium]
MAHYLRNFLHRRPLIMLATALVLSGCTALPLRPTTTPQPTAEPAYNFTLAALTGESITLADLRGRWVIVNFWATWCAPCRAEMPYLQQLAQTHTDTLVVLGINMREEPAEIAPFVEELGLTFPILLNPTNEMLLWYSPRGLPLTSVIAPNGVAAYRQYGPLEPAPFDVWLAEQLSP